MDMSLTKSESGSVLNKSHQNKTGRIKLNEHCLKKKTKKTGRRHQETEERPNQMRTKQEECIRTKEHTPNQKKITRKKMEERHRKIEEREKSNAHRQNKTRRKQQDNWRGKIK